MSIVLGKGGSSVNFFLFWGDISAKGDFFQCRWKWDPLIAARGSGEPSGFGQKNFLCLFSIKSMWELLGTLRFLWGLVFQWGCAVLRPVNWKVPSLRSRTPRLWLGRSAGALSSPSGSGRSPAAKRILLHLRHKHMCWKSFTISESIIMQ